MLLTGKTVIVTGAGGGLGAGIAAVCSREGANVVVADIRGDAASDVATSLPGDALAVHCDVGDDEAQAELVQKAVDAFGRVDGLVNNAGINFAKSVQETSALDGEPIIRVGLRAGV
ncbi:MAG: SDR family NAD(P)-dependent oxidoreductase, partial [Caldilineaceae bacterium SB0675_bin_29]|nr:SDR family NAD(P)-dependent oxidoreductase [Caldilineaceae bacterium SB0675_bin_29]